jgi:transcriptional regulator with XRE-family HTH domain
VSSLLAHPLQESALRWLYKLIEDLDAVPTTITRPPKESFSDRLLRLRKARGLTQHQLADASGISQRMIAHYETKAVRPPAKAVPVLAKALGVSFEALLGVERLRAQTPQISNLRLWRRFQKLEQLPPAARKAVLKVLDAYLAQYSIDDGFRNAG